MVAFGYALSSEEHGPRELVRFAQRAEEVGLSFALISDHFHPWTPKQPHSPFVWSVIGGIAQATQRLTLGTGVTCPTMRIHPAIVAQAAATAAAMMPGRFFLGVGTGENLNEHIIGAGWPSYQIRAAMLDEAITVIRRLWTGENVNHYGTYFTVEQARLFTLPDQLPALHVAAAGPTSADLAGRLGDGLISTSPKATIIEAFNQAGGTGKPKYGQITVCWAPDKAVAVRIAHEWWPNAALPGQLGQEIATPELFAQAVRLVRPEDVESVIICGPDPVPFVEAIRSFIEAGYDHIYLHQVGPDQEGFLRFYVDEVLPRV